MEDRAYYKLLLDKIKRNKNADFSLYKPNSLERRINRRLRGVNCSNYAQYVVYLNKHPEEYDKLLETITINVTEFFRNPELFEALKDIYIPYLIRQKITARKKVIRVWSAGTCNGEEAYSLAILFCEVLKEQIEHFKIKIYGTDIDKEAVLRAKEGIYDADELKEVSVFLREKYFKHVNKKYEVEQKLREITRFKLHNLVSDAFFPNIDLVLCRNVVIYFRKPLQELVYSNFARVLHNEGLLVLGKMETLWGFSNKYYKTLDSRKRIYKRIDISDGE